MQGTIENSGRWRYFYFKNGAIVAQMRRIVELEGKVQTGGLDAFLADFLAHAGVTQAVVAAFGKSLAKEQHGNVTVREYPKGGFLARIANLFRVPTDVLNAKPQRILCGRQGYALLTCLVVGRLRNVPVVFSAHNRIRQGRGSLGHIRFLIDASLIRQCHAAICHGPYLAQELAGIGVDANKIFMFDSDCADLMATHPAHLRAPEQDTERRILFLGRLVPLKGIYDLLEAFRKVLEQGLSAKLVYTGYGPDEHKLRAMVDQYGLANHVEFTGRLPYGSVGDEIQRSWLVVTPTRSAFPEGRCMVAMEALALGVPVVAPDAGPFPFLVKDRINGLLYHQDSVDQLASALSETLRDPGLRQRLAQGAIDSSASFRKADVSFAEATLRAYS